ncbi:hypothetical protein ACWGK6_44895 [Streptomyces violaceusniger]
MAGAHVGTDPGHSPAREDMPPLLAGSEGAGAVLRDARERLVKPGGVFVPHRSATTAVVRSASPVLEGLQDNPAVRERSCPSGAVEVEPLRHVPRP